MDPYAWFEARRGIQRATLDAWGVSVDSEGVIRTPYPGGATKFRKGLDKDDEGGRKFWWDPPGQAGQVPFLPPDFEPGSHMILVEGETDALALWQMAPEAARKQIVGLSGTNAWKDRYVEELFSTAKVVYVVLDNDDAYSVATEATNKAWQQIRGSLGRRARRVVLPQGVKDIAEFSMKYGWSAFRVLLDAASVPKMNYPRLDLTKEPKPVDWIIEGLIASPDITVFWGDGGVSKSLFIQALAVAMVRGDDTFLGLPLLKHGRVLYIDEENPEDIARSRLKKLGLTDALQKDLYYVWYAGVRLDTEPEKLYEDVQEFNPAALFIDSFSRVQIENENESDAMNRVFTNAIYPVARKLGVPVIALHHSNKTGGMRGNTAIRNAADLSLKVEAATQGGSTLVDTYRMFPDKPRRGQSINLSYKVVGFDAAGDRTDRLDDEVRVELQSTTSEEAY